MKICLKHLVNLYAGHLAGLVALTMLFMIMYNNARLAKPYRRPVGISPRI